MQLTQALKRAAQINRNGIATEFGERRRSWSEFARRVARLAGALRGLGIAPGDRVAILALNSDRYLEYFFAVAWAGGVFVPVNTRLAGPEVVYWLNDSESRVLFLDDNFHHLFEEIRAELETIENVVYMVDDASPQGMLPYEELVAGAEAAPDALAGGGDLAGIFYTGGTTGRSKGVMLSHTNLVSNAFNMMPAMQFTEASSYLHAAPMFHLADGACTFAVTMTGGRHSFISSFDPAAALEALDRYRVSNGLFVPTMINMMVQHPDVGRHDLSHLRRVMYGASPMPDAVLARAMALMPEVAFWHGYGQTEAAPALTQLAPEHHETRRGSIGRAVLGAEIRILDTDDRELPRGQVGEICGRGPNVMLGYWKQPELTAETLRGGWLHTGDGGYMDADGFVYIVDRLKDMIISGGENVYSAEVENAIHQHAAVAECAVIGVPDSDWGERVHAVVRLLEGETLSEAALIHHCRGLIANYKCPRSVDFRDEPLPLSGAGKILKTELRRPFWEGHEKQVN
ncbi:MAG: long-chain-fatty-acid--CoA ligase [Alphaproteobacteria bacterium]|nr:long-chain-fatty-acid--CoA ligase [Alphaproteobacteria bacterium]